MNIKRLLRILRIKFKQLVRVEPKINILKGIELEACGDLSYGGWMIPKHLLTGKVSVIDAGVGEEFSFSHQLIKECNAEIIALDPTPRAKVFIDTLQSPNVSFLQSGIAASRGKATFFMPTNSLNVSGSIIQELHVEGTGLDAEFISMSDAIKLAGQFDSLVVKIDIEGAEFDVIFSKDFQSVANRIKILCVEFHHRWPSFDSSKLTQAVVILEGLGFSSVWANPENNEEFTFAKL
tara:strand:- start:2417 stop:3124 length:708 start_codon:yes stop_codon:yes gene_type:complete